MILDKIGYSYNDLTIVPSKTTLVYSRSACNCFVDEKSKLPIFASPMTSVVDENNYELFEKNGITPIIPRSVDIEKRIELMNKEKWVAMSLDEFDKYFVRLETEKTGKCYNVCIDVANGHMFKIYKMCVSAKEKSQELGYDLHIMIGNIANADTYKYILSSVTYRKSNGYREPAIDYVRVGIGGGCGCTTSSNTGMHYPQASLIDECNKYTTYDSRKNGTKIVADGGIRNYSDVVKALALGADYVMIGSLFAQCIESAGIKYMRQSTKNMPVPFPLERYKNFEMNDNGEWFGYYTDEFIKENLKPWENDSHKEYEQRENELKFKKYIGELSVFFFGMASKHGQKAMGLTEIKTEEGMSKKLPVKYTLEQWTKNMISYLQSAMSYTGHFNLKAFIGDCNLIVNSQAEINSVNK